MREIFDYLTAVKCAALVLRVVSSTDTSIGTQVNVSCPAGQNFSTGHEMVKTLCLLSGDWSPQVPDCIGKIYIVHMKVTEFIYLTPTLQTTLLLLGRPVR